MNDNTKRRLNQEFAVIRRVCLIRAEVSDAALLAAIQLMELEQSLDEEPAEYLTRSERSAVRVRGVLADLQFSTDPVVVRLGSELSARITRWLS